MKKALVFAALLVCLSLAGISQIRIDLKTPWAEKHRLDEIKSGVALFLEWQGYRIVETGEDYAVWLRHYSERRLDRSRSDVRLQVVVTPPCALVLRAPLAWQDLVLPFRHERIDRGRDPGLDGFLGRRGRRRGDPGHVQAYYLGEMIAREIDVMISGLEERRW